MAAPAGEVVERERRHGDGGRRAGRDLGDRGAEAHRAWCAAPYQASGVKQSEP